MHRTEGANSVANYFANGPPGTTLEENWLNAVQEEIIAVLTAAGIDPLAASGDTRTQLATAIQALILINTNLIAAHSPVSIHPAAFIPLDDAEDWDVTAVRLANRASLNLQGFYAPVILPHGVTVTKVTLYGYRDDAAASMLLRLRRTDRQGSNDIMALAQANWTDGYNSIYDDTIASALIDNENYSYSLELQLNPNDSVNDVRFTGAKIAFTLP